MPITTPGLACIGLYSVPTSKPIPDIIFNWKFDVSKFRDPIGQKDLRNLDGRDTKVQAFLLEDPRMKPLLHAVKLIAAQKDKWTSIAFFDHHARYISVGIVELVARELDSTGLNIYISHQGKVIT